MSIQVALRHKTTYDYDRLVTLAPHILRLRPAPHCRTPIRSYSLKLEPETAWVNWQQDAFGNYLARLVFPERTRRLSFEVEVIADMVSINPFDFFLEPQAETFPFKYDAGQRADLVHYLVAHDRSPELLEWVASVDQTEARSVDFLVALNQRLANEISYLIRMEPGVQTCAETLRSGSGSCRDSSWLLVQIMRQLGLAARFVSGYLVQLTEDEKPVDGPAGPEADFTDLHAWAEVYLPGAGWIGLDPTSGLFAGEGHIPLACSPHFRSAAPIEGASDKAEVTFGFDNSVRRIHEDPRVTKPYSDEQWDAINRLGLAVDRDLKARDVRLSMGGEPTFVSTLDMESDQWNTDALGDDKRRQAEKLLWRLKQRYA
ncbi:MAG: transglutaminase family protein, partial [Gammaproteobacteria bacterium]|nr:transglutaminase family protein [Gammaproteobacteria bacterium]